jgi:PAS domain S-box-containing protein
MLPPKIPENEADRLQALLACEVLDTPDEERFDRLTRVAKNLFNVDITLVSLVDSARQWFKSKQGLDANETPRDISFCGHAILNKDIFLIENAIEDERFADNPLVTGPPNIRFYAGAPLANSEGYRLGTLCIIDSKPRKFSADDARNLRDLADCIERELVWMELKSQSEMLYKAQREKEQAANLLTQVIEASSEYAIVATDEEGIISTFNLGAEKMLGYSRDEVIQAHTPELFHLESELSERSASIATKLGKEISGYKALVAMAALEGSYQDEWQLIHKSGRKLNVLLTITPIADLDGKVDGFLGIIKDISEQKNQEARLERSRLELQNFFDLSLSFMCIATTEGFFDKINKTFTETLGYSETELKKDPFVSFIHPDDIETTQAEVVKLAKGEPTISFRNRYRKRDGSYIHLQWNAAPDIATGMLYASAIDVSKEHQQQLAMHKHASHIEAIIQNMADGLLVLDQNGHIMSSNAACLSIFGYDKQNITGRDFYYLLEDEDYKEPIFSEKQPLANALEKPADNKDCVPSEYTAKEYVGKRADGEVFIFEVRYSKIENDGEIYFIALVRDISERKRIERMQTEFVSVVSHELRTPLTSIAGALGLISGGALGEVEDKIKKMVDVAYSNSKRLSFLINDLLDMEKLVAGQMRLEVSWTLLNPIMVLSRESNLHYGEGKNIDIKLSLDDDIEVCVDQHRLIQVMSNLISNAIKFSPAGSQVEIATELLDEQRRVKIMVKDQGVGIPLSYQDKIFEKFIQVDASDSRNNHGSGLGLAITRGLLEKMNGEISVESSKGEGAVFSFSLPIAQTQYARTKNKPKQENNNAHAGKKAVKEKLRVLVIEDDPDIASLINLLLTNDGFEVTVATVGNVGLENLQQQQYHAMTLDLTLPDIDGRAILQFNQQQEKPVPIIVISEASEEELCKIKKDNPGTCWMRKPINSIRFNHYFEYIKKNSSNAPRVMILSTRTQQIDGLEDLLSPDYYAEHCFVLNTALRLVKEDVFSCIIFDTNIASAEKTLPILSAVKQWQGSCKVIAVSESSLSSDYEGFVDKTVTNEDVSTEQFKQSLKLFLN